MENDKYNSVLDAYRNGSFYEQSNSFDDGHSEDRNKANKDNKDNKYGFEDDDEEQDYYSQPIGNDYYNNLSNMRYPNEAPNQASNKKPNQITKEVKEIKENGDEYEEEKAELPQANITRPIIEYDPNAKIAVSDPSKASGGISGYTEYKLKGTDSQGEFDINRRYKEFYMLRSLLL